MSEWEKEKYIHDFICDNVTYDKLEKGVFPMRSSVHLDMELAYVKGLQNL